jgi:hypothetical protein
MPCGAALPPTGIIVVRCDLVEAELLIVIRADPLGGVDGTLLQRRINVTAGDLLGHDAELLQRLAGPTADAELEAFEIVDGLIVGVDWAMAGAAIADATIPVAATLRNSRRFMGLFPHSQA